MKFSRTFLLLWFSFFAVSLNANPEALRILQADNGTARGSDSRGWWVSMNGSEDKPTAPETLKAIVELGNVHSLAMREVRNEDLAILQPLGTTLTRFTINSRQLSDAAIPHLNHFQHVTHFGMRTDSKQPGITVEGMRQLKGFPKVESLGIGGHSFPPECLMLLPVIFPKAKYVDFNHTFKINEKLFTEFQKLEDLQKLNLGGCYQSDEATMRSLGKLKDLQELSVFHAGKYQYATLQSLKGHKKLRSLYVGDSLGRRGDLRAINDEDLKILLSIPSMEFFQTGADPNGALSDEAGNVLAQHPNFQSLILSRTEFTDQILRNLLKAPALQELVIEFNNHTAEGLSVLANYPKLKKLRLGGYRQGTTLDDARLQALSGIPNLESLQIWMHKDSSLSSAAVEKFLQSPAGKVAKIKYGLDFNMKYKTPGAK